MNHPFLALLVCITAASTAAAQSRLPLVTVTADNTEITKSCMIVIPPGTMIADTDGNGVIHVKGSGIRIEFQDGSELWGGPRPSDAAEGPWDTYAGTGIRVDNSKDVTIRKARIHGFKVGIWVTRTDGLAIQNADLSDNYRERLHSTPEAEASADWLFPHHNENDEWATQHGAGLYIRSASRPTISGITVRRGQNGILLHSVTEGLIYDCDCSFLSGWGLGMFRSSRCTISRNAFDFCIRGHSEGKYNRGQDSAGILMFEQCSNNGIIENSCTHSGDGIFGFAGLEALNGEGAPAEFDFKRKGCNDNVFIGNDLSYAAAHGLEMTFSFGNKVINNRFVENAICGIWGGYSQQTLIARNRFEGNGGMAYGLERGGVNIEHGAENIILGNEFINNRCGIHLWWDEQGDFESKAWGKANYQGVRDNIVAGNSFVINGKQPFGRPHPDRPLVGLQIRDDDTSPHVTGTIYARNTVAIDSTLGVERLVPAGVSLADQWDEKGVEFPSFPPSGTSRPVGNRAMLRGRDKIIMGVWGPWDHESPMIRLRSIGAEGHVYEVFGTGGDIEVSSGLKPVGVSQPGAIATVEPSTDPDAPSLVRIAPGADHNGIFPYRFIAHTGMTSLPFGGMIVAAAWQVTAFAWDDSTDPRKHIDAWRALAKKDNAFSVMAAAINFDYANGGPKDQPWAGPIKELAPGPDHFGMIARARLTLGKGSWRITTLSDDGVRVLADGKPIIENWTWHAPTSDSGTLTLDEEREVELIVEHFEIDGYAVLKLDIAPAE